MWPMRHCPDILRMLAVTLAPLTGVHATSCGDGDASTGSLPPPGMSGVSLERIVDGLDFPVHLTAPPGDDRLFVVEKSGRIRIVRGGALVQEPFLDVSDRVSNGSEQGLLSLAFHPAYAANGRFFVNFTDRGGDTRVEEFRVSDDPGQATPDPVATVLTVDQPFSNHNGGLIAFGPDGMLYVGTGDGGSAGDPRGNGQDPTTLLGALLRLDVDRPAPHVPPDNPFVGREGRDEIWATGLRNPWRFAFDRETGDLFVADVGQNRFEEVNAVASPGRGANYGWNVTEGVECFEPAQGCDREGLTQPVLVYGHDEGCSVTGGAVYRGQAVPSLRGHYLYADFCAGFVRSFRFAGGMAVDEREWPGLAPPEGSVTSFGEDADGEVYVLVADGAVYRIVEGS